MRVLVACEYSGIVRDAFIAKGHDAMSCDLLSTDAPGPHYQGDVFDVIDYPWDLMRCNISDIMITWNMHSYQIFPPTVFPEKVSLRLDGEQARSITVSKLMTYGRGCVITSGRTGIRALICVTDTGDHEGRMSTSWLPRRLLAKSRFRKRLLGTLMGFLQTMPQVILLGERISKTKTTSETTEPGIAGMAGSLHLRKEAVSSAALQTGNPKDCLRKSLGLAVQQSHVSLMAQLGMVS
jgi:hypothetical protein